MPKPIDQHQDTIFVFDFDSTLTQVEAFEELGEISLKGNPNKKEILKQIKQITDQGIDGEISFTESLKRRINLLSASEKDLESLVNRLKKKISGSVKRNRLFFKDYSSQIIVISAGFKEFIDPILRPLGITSDKIYGNTFRFDANGNMVGFDEENELSKPDGKIFQLKKLNLKGNIYVIGDGYSDYQMREAGIAHKFFAYTENITRQKILSTADHITPSFDEFLYLNKIKGSISYPKNRISVVLENGINQVAEDLFTKEGYQVRWSESKQFETDGKEASVWCFKDENPISEAAFSASKRLLCIGIAGSAGERGLDFCTHNGTAVFHTPEAEAISRAEFDLFHILKLAKTGTEGVKCLNEVSVGICGMGSEGQWLHQKLSGLEMKVVAWDASALLPSRNGHFVDSFKHLLGSDILVICRQSNEKYIPLSKAHFARKSSFQLVSSGGLKAIPQAILISLFQTEKCKAACLDEQVPHGFEKLRQLSNKFPIDVGFQQSIHSKQTAYRTAKEMAETIISYINTGNTASCLNLPEINFKDFPHSHRLLHIHRNVPGVLAEINSIFARHRLNISHQYLHTNTKIGYLVTDINKQYDTVVLEELKKVEATIRFRVLY